MIQRLKSSRINDAFHGNTNNEVSSGRNYKMTLASHFIINTTLNPSDYFRCEILWEKCYAF